MTETLRNQVDQIKAGGMTLSAIESEFSCSKSVISRIFQLYNNTPSFMPQKMLVIKVYGDFQLRINLTLQLEWLANSVLKGANLFFLQHLTV